MSLALKVLPRRRAPSLPLLATEYARSLGEFGTLCWTWPVLARAPLGDGQPVLVLPGLGTGDALTVPLRAFLKRLGYPTYGWDLGVNVGPTHRISAGIVDRLAEIHDRHGRAVSMVGWSLGGIFARQVTRQRPDLVRQVITLGSPFKLARHDQSNARLVYGAFRRFHVAELDLPLEAGEGPLPVPATSIYSRLDGIVSWRTCLDERSPLAENIEVLGSHLGYGHNVAAMWAVADRLALRDGEWREFAPPWWLRAAFGAPRP
ncbi:esterase/lipase family protein [Tsukamurella soli]|uniref:Alpha/beta hydrolase n=1 Tax=Tsukamurella soli TaxID=644556 RepID=A0ABP8KGJ7_9ACTN